MLTQEEQGRRFSEMSRIYGQNFKLPETHTLVLNAANPVVKSLISGEADEETRGLIAAQLYDLARMSTPSFGEGRGHGLPQPQQQAAGAAEQALTIMYILPGKSRVFVSGRVYHVWWVLRTARPRPHTGFFYQQKEKRRAASAAGGGADGKADCVHGWRQRCCC